MGWVIERMEKMIKSIDKLRVLGKDYNVEFVDCICGDSTIRGRHYDGEGKIMVALKTAEGGDVCTDDLITTLLHEILHAIFDRQNLNQDEHMIALLSTGIQDLFKNNLKLYKAIGEFNEK